MKKGRDSGKAYHVKKEQKRKKKRDKELNEMLERAFDSALRKVGR